MTKCRSLVDLHGEPLDRGMLLLWVYPPVASAEAGAEGSLPAAVAQAHAAQLGELGREPHADLRTQQKQCLYRCCNFNTNYICAYPSLYGSLAGTLFDRKNGGSPTGGCVTPACGEGDPPPCGQSGCAHATSTPSTPHRSRWLGGCNRSLSSRTLLDLHTSTSKGG